MFAFGRVFKQDLIDFSGSLYDRNDIFTIVKVEGKYTVVDSFFDPIMPLIDNMLGEYDYLTGLIPYMESGFWGDLNIDGTSVIPPVYKKASKILLLH